MLRAITESNLFLFFERLSRIVSVGFFLVGLPVLVASWGPVIEATAQRVEADERLKSLSEQIQRMRDEVGK